MSDNEISDVESIVSDDEEEVQNQKTNFSLKKSFKNDDNEVDDEEDDEEDAEEENLDDEELFSDDMQEYDSENDESKNINGVDASIPFIQDESLNPTLIIPDEFDNDSDANSDDEDDEDTNYLEKFDSEVRDNYIVKNHPEDRLHNADEINALSKVKRNINNEIVDDLHKTIPLLTKYEKARILGIRAKQLNNGAKPYVKLERPIIDGMLIAINELQEKKLPFIIRRPIPNGSFEYWPLHELDVI